MDGDPVEGEPSETEQTTTLAEAFTNLCPQYMAMGMTYDEFWHSNTARHYAVRKAWKVQRNARNWEMWLQGAYFYDALIKVAPVMRSSLTNANVQPGEYPSEPYPLDEQEAEEREERDRRRNYYRMLARLTAEGDREAHERAVNENGKH